ncbi:MAG: hypothetical protein DHS20C18_45090 [Saprospiraceae bacterium]|nr:MAG: hypothetical protein DHS20C18_45090 [Saprospiraceae bacterium]
MIYPNLQFEIPPGVGSSLSLVFEFPLIQTRFEDFLQQNEIEESSVNGIYPYSATITSLDGGEYFFVQEAEVRVCQVGEDCRPELDAVFYVDNLNGRAKRDIGFLTGLQNVKSLMGGPEFRLEVVLRLRLGEVTPYAVSSKLDVSFEAVR